MPTPYSALASFVNPPPDSGPYLVNIYSGYADFRAPSLRLFRQHPSHSGGKRGKITEFSTSARRNFLKKIFSLSTFPELFVTLTYPKFYPADSNIWKQHLDNFFLAIRRRFLGSWFFWKLEPQKRGAPHFHLCGSLGSKKFPIVLLRKFIAETWFRVVGIMYPEHLRAGTQADFVDDSSDKVKRYVCKYVGKSTASDLPEWATPGRFWGIIGRENLPASPCCHVLLPKDTFCKLRRLVRKWIGRFSSSAKYANRLKKLPSFFILAGHGFLFRLLECSVGFSLPQHDGPLFSTVLDLETVPF